MTFIRLLMWWSMVVVVFSQAQCRGDVLLTRSNVQNYSTCVTFAGSLTVSDADMMTEDLSLEVLADVQGNLTISGCSSLSSLLLPALRIVSGSVIVERNPLISSLFPLNITVGGDLRIAQNPALSSLDGLFQPVWQRSVSIESNSILSSLAPMSPVKIAGQLRIVNNPQFTTLFGLQNLTTMNGIVLTSLPLLTSLDYLPSCSVINGTLSLISLQSLVNISSLSTLQQAAVVTLRDLPLLEDISPLTSLVSVGYFGLSYLPKLQALRGFDSLIVESFFINTCDKLTDVQGFSMVTYLRIFGLVGNPQLTQVVGFNQVQRVGSIVVSANPNLTNFSALSQLQSVGSLEIEQNGIDNVNFLSAVTSVNGSVRLYGNNMSDSTGLRNLVSVAGDFYFKNEQSSSIYNLGNLKEVGGILEISRNPLLANVSGFANLTSVGGIAIYDNPMLQDLSGFAKLRIADSIQIYGCPQLEEIFAFANVSTLSRLSVHDCANLTSLAGFAQVAEVTAQIYIAALPLLSSVDFPSLNAVADLSISRMPIMKNMNGFTSLQSIESLSLESNANLVEISGLCDVSRIQGFTIRNSPMLCCSSVLRSLSYGRAHLNSYDYWFYTLENCASTCVGLAAVSCKCNTLTQKRCYNEGICINTNTSFECACPEGYEGDLCQIQIPHITSVSPATIDHSGNAVIEVHGVRFPTRPICLFEDIIGKTLYTPVPTPTVVYCVAPPDYRNDSYYADLVVYNQYTAAETSVPRKLIYYTFLVCPVPTAVLRAGTCQRCPEGGWCDDRRVWPRMGYWSVSEYGDPLKCRIAAACPGALGEVATYPIALLADGERKTQVCAEGYEAVACGKCSLRFYQGIYGACIPCEIDAAGVAETTGTIIFAVLLFAVLAVAVATLEEEKMAVFATVLMGLQRALSTSQLTATRYGGDALNSIFGSLSFLNFDVQFVKPGCVVSELDFEGVFWATIGIVLLAAVFFVFAAFVRSRLVSNSQLEMYGKIEEQEHSGSATPTTTDHKGRSGSVSTEGKERGSASEFSATPDARSRPTSDVGRMVELQYMPDLGLTPAEPLHTNDDVPSSSSPPLPPSYASQENFSRASNMTSQSFHKDGRGGVRKRKHVFTRSALFRRRAVHSLIMLGLLIHFQICLRCFQGLVCDQRPAASAGAPTYFLRAAVDKACYAGGYQGAMFFIWVVLLTYAIGFPLWCFVQVYKVRRGGELHVSLAKTQRFGFLYRELKEEFFWFRSSAFVVNFFIALFSTAIRVGEVQTFLNGLVFMLYIESIVFLRPFVGTRNVVPAVLGIVGLLVNVISLAFEASSHDSFYESYLFGLIILGMITGFMTHVALKIRTYRITKAASLPLS